MHNRVSSLGFTLIEALASAALLGVGIAGAMGTLSAIANSETRARNRDLVQRLALQKYDEVISTNSQALASSSGDFSDRSLPDYTWNLSVDPSQVTNLDTVTVTVQKQGSTHDAVGTAEGMIYLSPNATSAAPTTTGTTGGG